MSITNDILKAFGLQGEIRPLSGGQNTSFRVQTAVLKPVDNSQYHEWTSSILAQVTPQGYRLSKPLKSVHGTYSYRGWCCTSFEPGEHRKGAVEQKLRVARLLHRDLALIEPGMVPPADDPWTRAHRIAWKKDPLPPSISAVAQLTLEPLLQGLRQWQDQADLKVQIVHSDLSGNVLFHDSLDPLVIDFSPTIGPTEYAEAILVCDCIAWEGSPVSDLQLLPSTDFYREMVTRAVIFRLAVTALVAGDDDRSFLEEYEAFRPILTVTKGHPA